MFNHYTGVAMTRSRHMLYLATAIALWLPGYLAAQQPTQPAAHPARALSAQESRVQSTIVALFAAAERSDMAALDSIYAGDSLTIIEGASMNRGWADYRDHHLAPEMKEMTGFQYRVADIEPRVSGNLAWATFRYTLKANAAGRPVDIVGRGTAILERRGDRWVVRHTQTSGRARRPTDPPAA